MDFGNESYRLLAGDCLELMKSLPDSSVDLILTDPPYFKVKDEPWDNQWAKPQQFLTWMDQVLEQFQRILKPNGCLYLFASPQMAARVEVLISDRFNVLNSIRWAKPKFSTKAEMFRKSDLRSYFPNWEACIFAEQKDFMFEPIRSYLESERMAAGLTRDDVRRHFAGKLGTKGKISGHFYDRVQWMLPTEQMYSWLQECHGPEHLKRSHSSLEEEFNQLRRFFSVSDDVPYTDTWHFDTVKRYQGKHPCEKPQSMLEHIISTSSSSGAVVFDAFTGTGSTGVAAIKLGRKFLGCEMADHYLEKAEARIAELIAANDNKSVD